MPVKAIARLYFRDGTETQTVTVDEVNGEQVSIKMSNGRWTTIRKCDVLSAWIENDHGSSVAKMNSLVTTLGG